MTIYGYARVSAKDQNLDTQVEQLESFGCEKILTEKITGVAQDKQLNELVEKLTDEDSLVVTGMDRLGRSTKQLLQLIDLLEEKKVRLVILDMEVDTSKTLGKFFLTVMAAMSEMQRQTLKEKQTRGIANRRKKGLHMGRKPTFGKEQMEEAVHQSQTTDKTISEICDATGVSRSSLYRELKARGIR